MSVAQSAIPFPAPRGGALPKLIERERRRRRRRVTTWWMMAFAVPLLAAVAWVLARPKPLPLAARFRFEAVTQGDVVREVRATGHVEAVSTVQVGAEISGRIATVEVDYNDRVQKGQVLARFVRVALDAQVAQTQANLAAARAALEQAVIDREQAARNLARAQHLYETRVLSDADREAAIQAEAVARARVAAATSQLRAQEAGAVVARDNLDHAVVRAPIDGVVITRNVDPGQTVAAAFATPTLFTVAEDLRRMRVIAAVDEADVAEVATGQRATFTVNAFGDRTFEGVVTEVRNSPVIVQDVVTYGTVVEVANDDMALKPGMTASVRVQTAKAERALRVPAAALRFRPPGSADEARPGVWVLDGGALRRIEVQPGISDGELTAVEGDLGAARSVITELTPEGKKAYGLVH